jgi:hypothetical protein
VILFASAITVVPLSRVFCGSNFPKGLDFDCLTAALLGVEALFGTATGIAYDFGQTDVIISQLNISWLIILPE